MHAEATMKELKRHSPTTSDLQKMAPDSKALCRQTLIKVKNARQKKPRIRRLKYTCEAKIHVAVTAGDEGSSSGEEKNNVHPDKKEREIHESMQISLSLTTSEGDRSVLRNGAVLTDFGGKKCEENNDQKELSYGSVSVIGNRKDMEDAVSIEMGFAVKDKRKCDFFAVYDGHGGPQVARACRERLHQLVGEELEKLGSGNTVDWEGMMEGCFGKMDKEVADNAAVGTVGSTAVVALVADDVVVVANCGDSRAVMGRGGDEALALSIDHKPERPDELMRIEASGGRVIDWNGHRVLGVLATSRSIGDEHLRPYIICKPEVTVTRRSNEDEFLILASDGLWDVVSNEVACLVVRKCLSGQIRKVTSEVGNGNQSRAAKAAALLTELAMAKGSRDNTSVIVVELSNHKI